MPTFPIRRPRVRTLVVAAALALAPSAAAHAQGPYTSLTFFGDSYSDTGNADILAPFAIPPIGDPTPPPYFDGRFSDGQVWVEYLSAALARPFSAAPVFLPALPEGNYAIGGARSGGPTAGIVPTTGDQIARRLATGVPLDPTGLYTLFSGGNDMRDIGQLTQLDDASRRALTVAAALRVARQADSLAAAGARSILLPYLGDVGYFPEAVNDPTRSGILHALTPIFNATLAQRVAELRVDRPATTFFDLRLDDLFAQILADASLGGPRFGITNVTTACFAPGAPSCAVSLFVDGQHPTTVGHRLIAGAALGLVGNGVAVVPEPTTVVLLGGGLLLIGGVSVRRRGRAAPLASSRS